MTSESARTVDPSMEEFAGHSVRRLFQATRPKFLPASILPVISGTAWGFQVSGNFDFAIFMLALIATICVHAGANVLNDVGDESGGTDRCNMDRIYPYTGGSRFIQAGIMTATGMTRLGISLLGAAAVAGFLLLLAKGPMILLFGLLGVTLAIIYSLGPMRLSSMGLGEVAVAVAFGILPVTGAAWLQSGVVDGDSILFSLPISAWVAAILLINEVPDIDADGSSGKRTLPVRFGLNGTAILYIGAQFAATAGVILLVATGSLPLMSPLVPIGLLALSFKAAAAIRKGLHDRNGLRRAIETTLGIHTFGTLWLCGCVFFNAWDPAA